MIPPKDLSIGELSAWSQISSGRGRAQRRGFWFAALLAAGVGIPHALSTQAWRFAQVPLPPSTPPAQEVAESPPSEHRLRPLPPDRSQEASRRTNSRRNPFAVASPVSTAGGGSSSSVTGSAVPVGLPFLRLTGVVHDQSRAMAMVDDGNDNESLGVGDTLTLGQFAGRGFRVKAISFEKGLMSITNGPSTYHYRIAE